MAKSQQLKANLYYSKNTKLPMTTISSQLTLPVMESFYTLQGEGFHQGRAAYFIRLGGCDVGCFWCDVKEFLAIATMKLKARDIRAKSIYHSYRFSTVRHSLSILFEAIYIINNKHDMYIITDINSQFK